MADIDYFAYGSNLHPLRLTERVPGARVVETYCLAGYALVFHKRGRDGSGKCDIVPGEAPGDAVWGVVYRMDAGGKAVLDQIEGRGYRAQTLRELPGVYAYRADPDHIDASLEPYGWYRDLVVSGASYHGLPAPYIRAVREQAAVDDPDAAREQLHRRLLQRMEFTP